MPNSRRRRFSVQKDIVSRGQNDSRVATKTTETLNVQGRSKIQATSSKTVPQIITPSTQRGSACSISTSVSSIKADKDVEANGSTIDLYYTLSVENFEMNIAVLDESKEITTISNDKNKKKRGARQLARSREVQKKLPRQHRVKVRSPKRRASTTADMNPALDNEELSNNRTVGTNAIDWEQELESCILENTTELDSVENFERASSHSMGDMCRICHSGESLSAELGPLISACGCRGTVGRVHVKCLERWLTESGKSRCELCGTRYSTRRVHRYGVPRALLMWILSQNAKQLMVDTLGIMLMSPLAVLAAWLSGRTLAGLMTQDSQVTPWPLASTFVLACMTLVCYYCWIVSAATRHALGWWIWYRSQYEVRLQLEPVEQ